MDPRSPAPDGGADRLEVVRELERRRVQAEVRARMFGGAPAPVTVDRFELRRKLGEGAMGVVYAAFDPRLQREVALKLLTAVPRGRRDAWLAEARALARLSHPNVLAVHEAGDHAGVAFLVSELVVGGTLRAWLARSPPPRTSETLALLLDVGRGLEAAHQRGLVHRDLKPENVLVGVDGRPRIADFGLALADEAMVRPPGGDRGSPLPGTLAYMAPEQLRGERADPRSDQYAFCVVAFEAIFGVHPFEASTSGELLRAMEAGAVRSVPPAHPAARHLAALRRGLAPDAAARWPSTSELLAALGARAGSSSRAWVAAPVGALLLVGAGAGAWIQIGERDLAHRVVELTEQGRYVECVELLDEGDVGDGLLHSWVGCAVATQDPGRVDRVCEAWPRRTRAVPPEVCSPTVRAARRLFASGKSRECAETLLAAPPTTAGLLQLSACVGPLRDPSLYRRQCLYQGALRPAGTPAPSCGPVVEVAPR